MRYIRVSNNWTVTAFVLLQVLLSSLSCYCTAFADSSHGFRSNPRPIDPNGWPDRFPAKEHCSKCGLCETTFVSSVQEACAFLGEGMARMDLAETKVHGRKRRSLMVGIDSNNAEADEARFGVLHEPLRLAKGNIEQAQWTGVVTSIALSMLESSMVDAVVCVATRSNATTNANGESNNDDNQQWSYPEPIVARTSEQVLQGRGVKPALAPSLRLLDEIKSDSSIRNLLFCGVGCAVQAFRAVQDDLNLENIYVLGTNCVDNSPTPEAAQRFLQEGVKISVDEKVQGYEFMQDFKVHVKTSQGGYTTKPYFSLPGTIAGPSIATSCLACFDYTNGLADVVVGYMGAPLDSSSKRMDQSYQTLTIRNKRGSQMVQAATQANRLQVGEIATGQGSHETLALATVGADSIVLGMLGDEVPDQGMPVWMGTFMAFIISNFVSPKGVSFARYSIDYHILRNYLHILEAWGEERAKTAMPQNARDIVDHYLNLSKDNTMRKLRARILSQKNHEC